MTKPRHAAELTFEATAPANDERQRELFGTQIAHARKARGWTIDEAAQRGGLTRKTWGRIEAGHSLRITTLKGIDQAFDLVNGMAANAYYSGGDHRKRFLHEVMAPMDPYYNSDAVTREPERTPVLVDAESLFDVARRLPLQDMRRLRDMLDGAVRSIEQEGRDSRVSAAIEFGIAQGRQMSNAMRRIDDALTLGDTAALGEARVSWLVAKDRFSSVEVLLDQVSAADADEARREIESALKREGTDLRYVLETHPFDHHPKARG
jgi:transcriptional regulator with XRE-family HTH domain